MPAYRDQSGRMLRLARFLWILADILTILLVIRLVLGLLGANPETPFVQFIRRLSEPLVAPFAGIVPGGGGFEWAVVVAIIVYLLLVAVIVRLLASVASGETPGDLDDHLSE